MIDVLSVVVNEKKNEVVITGVDLDSIWVNHDEADETAECTEVAYKFDISLSGARKYLYLVTKNNKKANEFKYMDQRLEALVGQTIHLSNNFRVKEA
jgi:response regulator of citrate/malate metabolism